MSVRLPPLAARVHRAPRALTRTVEGWRLSVPPSKRAFCNSRLDHPDSPLSMIIKFARTTSDLTRTLSGPYLSDALNKTARTASSFSIAFRRRTSIASLKRTLQVRALTFSNCSSWPQPMSASRTSESFQMVSRFSVTLALSRMTRSALSRFSALSCGKSGSSSCASFNQSQRSSSFDHIAGHSAFVSAAVRGSLPTHAAFWPESA
mmetsp:Transcript_72504/g.120032  ORF Transcript_72504/g.120032 Transcript_72504/m.120032 type:complete len:206 (+) Transcript_72504:588-1205(+)